MAISWITSSILVYVGLLSCADGAVRFANYYSKGMVLQSSPAKAQIWGYSTSSKDTVDVYVNGTLTLRATTVPHGNGSRWSALLPPMAAGGPYAIEARGLTSQSVIDDVWFGDVWVCSGQSNMEFTFASVMNYTETLDRAVKFNNIRFLHIRHATSNVTREEPVIQAKWQAPGHDRGTRQISAVCILYGMELSPHLNGRPIGLVETSWGGTRIESWSSTDALSQCPNDHSTLNSDKDHPSVLWNAMVAPLTPMTIYGTIWYQGESNAGYFVDYNCSFPAMIADWRSKFNTASQSQTNNMFPFGFVQLATVVNRTVHAGLPDLRWSQTLGYGYVPNPAMQNVFMAVAMDLPDFNSPYGAIHPRDKQDVAIRLALAGRAVAYGESNLDFQGPFPSSYIAHPNTLTIEFDDGNSILDIRTSRGFEACCVHDAAQSSTCRFWISTNITAHDQTSVTIDTSVCHGYNHVVAGVRYAWEASPCVFKMCAIYELATDLPAPGFRRMLPFN